MAFINPQTRITLCLRWGLKVNGTLILSSWCCFTEEACWEPSEPNVPSPMCTQGLACHMLRMLRYEALFLGRGPGQLQAPSTEDPGGHRPAPGMVMKCVYLPRN